MKTRRRNLLTVLLVLAAVCLGLGLAAEAQAQQAVYYTAGPASQAVYYSDPPVYQVQYYRVYQGASWHWNPALGWHTHAHYIDTPYWVPVNYAYSQPLSAPTITTYYRR